MNKEAFRNLIISEFSHVPNKGQNELIERLLEFSISSSGYEAFILKGYAGTGKTSILAAYLNALMGMRVKSKVLAPTGRAAKVIGLHAKMSAYTIHKQIYRRKSKADLSSPLSLNANLHKNTVFVVDEASMIGDYTLEKSGNVSNRSLLADLVEYVYSGTGCKLILMGDDGQLPPVGSDYSPALSERYMKHHFPVLNISTFKLDEVLRQAKASDILSNATALRGNKDNHVSFKLTDRNDLIRINGLELQDELETSYQKHGMEGTILITRSNKNANIYNQQIRARLLWFEEILCPGDCLMAVKNNYHWIDENSDIGFIANGEMFKVLRILKYENFFGFEFARVVVSFIDYSDHGEIELVVLFETLTTDGPALERERMKELFFEVEKDYSHIREKKKRYEAILGDPYFNALQVKYAYAVTCHKSQGGQWKHVYIDQGFVPEDQQGLEQKRWMYTALTRATDKAFLVNFSEDYFSLQTHLI
jgi:exodeoxyribonuclease-5